MRSFLPLFCIALITTSFGCNENKDNKVSLTSPVIENKTEEGKPANPQVDILTFEQDSIGWGYDISIDGQLYIHQPHIPAIPGNQGFDTEENAKQAAEFVVNKIKQKIMPPTVSPRELDSLGLLRI